MARLIYSAIASLDGYVEDSDGTFNWATPDEEVHAFINDLVRPVGTYLYGRRMYETMLYWETAQSVPDRRDCSEDFAEIWRSADKIVYSKTLDAATSARTRIERAFDPEEVRQIKSTAEADITVGGADLAGQALRLGLVEELQLFLVPFIVGGGKHFLPRDVRVELELQDERRFAGGVVYFRYRIHL